MKNFDPNFIPASCRGEKCNMCGEQARHRVEETPLPDDPTACGGYCGFLKIGRHISTAYVCSKCFGKIMGRTTIPGFVGE